MRQLCLLIFSVLWMAFFFGQEPEKAQLIDSGTSEHLSETQPNGYFLFEIDDLKCDPDVDAAAYPGSKSGEGFRFQPLTLESQQTTNFIDGLNQPDRSTEKRDQHLKPEMTKKPILKTTKYQLL